MSRNNNNIVTVEELYRELDDPEIFKRKSNREPKRETKNSTSFKITPDPSELKIGEHGDPHNNPIALKDSRTRLRKEREKAYLYLQSDFQVNWSNPHFVIGYLTKEGTFYNIVKDHSVHKDTFKLIGRERWEELPTFTEITVRDVTHPSKRSLSNK